MLIAFCFFELDVSRKLNDDAKVRKYYNRIYFLEDTNEDISDSAPTTDKDSENIDKKDDNEVKSEKSQDDQEKNASNWNT